MEQSDIELLEAYRRDADERAFAVLVGRHRSWIYAAAQRRLGDSHAADDATQTVFLILAEKASELTQSMSGVLSAWLFHVMHFACRRVRRSQSRRMLQEEQVGEERLSTRAEMRGTAQADGEAMELLTLLEDSIAHLPVRERELIVRRFYQRESFAGIGGGCGISADAARKRIDRTLASLRAAMLRDGCDVLPETFLANSRRTKLRVSTFRESASPRRVAALVKGTVDMVEQANACEFPVVSAEFIVTDVEASIHFFEKLGFRRRYVEALDAMGRMPRASLVAGVGRIWLRRADASEGTKPTPGVTLYFWIDGGAEGLIAHRNRITGQGVAVSPFTDDLSLRNFTITTPDGYAIGFFSQYREV